MDLTIRMRIFSDVKLRVANFFEIGDKFFTALTMLRYESKASLCSTIKENSIFILA